VVENGYEKRIAALLERLGRLAFTESYSQGLNPVQWEVLRYLARANRFSNTAMALTAYLGLTKGTVSQSVKALEGKGLLRKRADSRDRRNVRLFLTAAGRRLLFRDPLRGIEEASATMPERVRRRLAADLNSLLGHSLAVRGRQPFGLCRECRYFARNHPDGGPHRCLLLEEPLSNPDSGLICLEQTAA